MQLQTLVIIRPGGLVSKKKNLLTCDSIYLVYTTLKTHYMVFWCVFWCIFWYKTHKYHIIVIIWCQFHHVCATPAPPHHHLFQNETRNVTSRHRSMASTPGHPLSQRSQGCLVHVSACELHHITSCYIIDLCVQVLWAVFQKDILWTCVWTRNRHTKMYAHALMKLHTTFLLLLFMPVHLHHDERNKKYLPHMPYILLSWDTQIAASIHLEPPWQGGRCQSQMHSSHQGHWDVGFGLEVVPRSGNNDWKNGMDQLLKHIPK